MPRLKRAVRRHWVIWLALFGALIGYGGYLWTQVSPILSSRYADVSYVVPSAPRLVAGNGETVYRIDPTRSQALYQVDEKIAGATADRVTGTTSGMAGDLAINAAAPSASRVGDIVVNLEQLHSNNGLRDARIRAAFLGSHTHPLARFTTTAISGLPSSIQPGRSYTFTLSGALTVKAVTAPVSWNVQAEIGNGELKATATTTVRQSTFGIGPISIAGLVSTSDRVSLTLKLDAFDPSRYAVPTLISAPAARHAGHGPSFRKFVQPVLEASCASCHNAGQVGAAHWQLRTAGDAAAIADGIRVVTRAGYMPPWPASNLGVALAHPKALDQKTIDLLSRWAAAGGPLDVPASTPIRPTAGAGAPRPRNDEVLKMPAPYTGSMSAPNDYRCFVLDPRVTSPTYITGYAFQPDQIKEIHHAQVFYIPADQRQRIAAADGADGKPGWQCYAGPALDVRAAVRSRPGGPLAFRTFTGEPGLIAGWAPGQDPVVYPDDAGVLLQPGDVLVLQIHYHYDLPPTPDRSVLSVQTEPGTANVHPVEIVNPLAPVEIPCVAGVQSVLCDRSTASADDARLYGPAGLVESALLRICRRTPAELVAGFDGIAHSSCDTHVPASGQIIAVMGHMHTLGRSFRLTLDPGTPQQQVLLDIPTWNFDWQLNYPLAAPIHVDAGETVRIECTWDRSLDPNRPPKYIMFAEGTEDEMCFSTYALIPDRTP